MDRNFRDTYAVFGTDAEGDGAPVVAAYRADMKAGWHFSTELHPTLMFFAVDPSQSAQAAGCRD
jgi:hypothetical protein